MVFNVFSLLIFTIANFNFSLSCVQHQRLCKERRLIIKRLFQHEDKVDNEERVDFKYNETDETWLSPLSLFKNIRRMQDYNQDGFLQLLFFLLNVAVLVMQLVKSIAYSILPTTREQNTGEFKHPVLKFMESTLYLCDFSYRIHPSTLLDRLIAVLILQFLLLRLRALYRRLKTAKVNRYRYRRINMVDLRMQAGSYLQGDLCAWLRFFKQAAKAKCDCSDHQTLLQGEHGRTMRDLGFQLNKLERIDRVYLFNQIDFNCCFANTGIRLTDAHLDQQQRCHRHSLTEPYNQVGFDCSSSTNLEANNFETKKPDNWSSKWLDYLLTFKQPGWRAHLPKPEHPMQPAHLSWLVVLYIYISFWQFVAYSLSLASLCYIAINDDRSVPAKQGYLAGWTLPPYLSALAQQRIFLALVQGSLTVTAFAVNLQDCGIMAYAFIFSMSRTNKVLLMLDRELDFYRAHQRAFIKFLRDKRLVLESATVRPKKGQFGSQGSPSVRFIEGVLLDESYEHFEGNSAGEALEGAVHFPLNTEPRKSFASAQTDELMRGFVFSSNTKRTVIFDTALNWYKKGIEPESVSEFNKNLSHLLNLVEILHMELEDLREFFGNFLNVCIIFGCFATTISFPLLLSMSPPVEEVDFWRHRAGFHLALSSCFIGFVPMVYALAVGASCERSSCRVCRKLTALALDELRLVERNLHRRLQRQAAFLARLENRTFIVLGNYPLTFTSLTTILGWIFSGTLLVQKFYL